MNESTTLSHASDTENQLFVRKRFYHPKLLAAYSILGNLPLAFFLYGLNVYRRGSFWMGRIILLLSALAIIGMSIALAVGAKGFGIPWTLFSIFVGIGLMKAEKSGYQRAIANGGTPAKWWPPLMFIVADILAISLIEWFFAPSE
jgi:hypothetical protein